MVLEKIRVLGRKVSSDDTDLVEDVVKSAQEYVAVVAEMGVIEMNLTYEPGESQRERIQNIDKKRTIIHNKFIDAVNIANRLAESVDAEPIYTGGSARREYGDFAFEIVKELFETRK